MQDHRIYGDDVAAAGYVSVEKMILNGKTDKDLFNAYAGESQGRGLRKEENVHHINGVRDDNRIENLRITVYNE